MSEHVSSYVRCRIKQILITKGNIQSENKWGWASRAENQVRLKPHEPPCSAATVLFITWIWR